MISVNAKRDGSNFKIIPASFLAKINDKRFYDLFDTFIVAGFRLKQRAWEFCTFFEENIIKNKKIHVFVYFIYSIKVRVAHCQ